MKITHFAISLPVLTCLVSWTPPDSNVVLGGTNDTDGHSDTTMNMLPYRGILAGWGNIVGTPSGAPYHAGVTGNHNDANLFSTIIAGAHNHASLNANTSDLSSYLRNSGVFGVYNVIPEGSSGVLISGYGNTVTADNSLVSGTINTVEGATVGSSSSHSSAIGYGNHVASSQGWAVGNSNTVTETAGVAIGTGLTSSKSYSTALGKWNTPMGTDDLLVIGNGSDDSNRSTALTILKNGSVIIPGEVTLSGNTILASATTQSLTVSGNVSLQGTTTAQNLTVSGNSTLQGSITADDFNSTGTATLTDLDATTLDVTSTSNLADLNATGTVTVDDLNATGTTSLAATTATDLTPSGTTALADTTAQSLTVSGATVLQGSVILAAPQGDISMGIYAP
ncbi:MAG: hypothetical protein AB8D78_01705 [Akkermansiaceae bacterium]